MFVVLLRFAAAKAKAQNFMAAHNAWIERGFRDGVFLLTGGIRPGTGGAIFAHNVSRDELAARVNDDPFVVENIVDAEIVDVAPGRADPRLAFLMA